MNVKIDLDKLGNHVRITHNGYRVQIPFENLNDLITDLKKEQKKFYASID